MRSFVFVGGVALVAGSASASIMAIGPTEFDGTPDVVTFSEVADGTLSPFTVGAASFGAQGIVVDSSPIASPSGGNVLFSQTRDGEDKIEVTFAYGMTAVGAYFDHSGSQTGDLELEFYNGDTLLGTVLATNLRGGVTSGASWVGGATDGALITGVVFRDVNTLEDVSFRIDDLTFVPAPGAAGLLGLGLLAMRRRR